MLALAAVAAADTPHTFRFDPPPPGPGASQGAPSVAVAGSFNGWSRDADPMADPDGDGTYEVTLQLPDGVHFYKFVVGGDRWLNDPAGDKELEQGDGLGGVNSAVLVGPDARKLPPAKPNHINAAGILHAPSDPAYFSATADGLARVVALAQPNDVERVVVNVLGRGSTELTRVGTSRGFDRWAGLIRSDFSLSRYTITFHDGEAVFHYDAGDLGSPAPRHTTPTGGAGAHSDIPAWPRDAVWYQVFPERFRNGDKGNDPPDTKPWTSDWWDTLEGETPGSQHFYANAGNVWRRRYGGDLQGLREKLPYLRELGVNAIYLTPIFEAESAHKYDATDHRHIDDNFGVVEDPASFAHVGMPAETDDPSSWRWTPSDLLFLDFLDAAHAQGFRVVIDGVFNHVGVAHFAFQDVLRNGRNSPHAEWFEITDWGDPSKWGQEPWHAHHGKAGGIQWKAWDRDNGDLPVFRKDAALGLAPGPREHVLAVTRRWMRPVVDGVGRLGIDGWRLDVPHDVPMAFWREWRRLVKELNPDAYIVGEVWGDASTWLKGDSFDATMNYPFAMASERFFVDRSTATTPREFGDALTSLYMNYPLASALAMQNLFVSHDTERLASLFRNPDRNYDQGSRLQDGASYDTAKPTAADAARMKQAVAVQYLFPGAPMTYYGDEAGMWGPDDPSNRMPMVWQDLGPYAGEGVAFDAELFAWYRRLAAVRRASPAIRNGFFRVVEADDERGLLVLARELEAERVLIVVNRSDRETAWRPGSGRWRDLLDPAAARVAGGEDGRPVLQLSGNGIEEVTLGAYQTAVLAPVSD